AQMGTQVIAGQFHLERPRAVRQRNTDAEIGRDQVLLVVDVQAGKGRAFDVQFPSVGTRPTWGSIAKDRHAGSGFEIPHPAKVLVVVPHARQTWLLLPGKVGRIEDAVGQYLPRPIRSPRGARRAVTPMVRGRLRNNRFRRPRGVRWPTGES